MDFRFFAKSDIVFGSGAAGGLPDILRERGAGKALVICDSFGSGAAERVLGLVRQAVPAVSFGEVPACPTVSQAEEAAGLARKEDVDIVLALGDGGCMDLAKAVGLLTVNPGPIGRFGGAVKPENPALPLIAVPCAAGASGEMTDICTLVESESMASLVIRDKSLVPSKLIVDPELTSGLPPELTAAAGMDALAHAAESYISSCSTPLTEYHSLIGLKILYQSIVAAVEDGSDMTAREQMLLGSVITGVALSNTGSGLANAIAHNLSARFGLSHGMASAAVLPYVMESCAGSCPEKMVLMAQTIGLPITGQMKKDRYLFSEELMRLTSELDIKPLSRQGVGEAALEELVDGVLREAALSFDPRRELSGDELRFILRQAF